MMDFFKFSYFHNEVLSDDMMDLQWICICFVCFLSLFLSLVRFICVSHFFKTWYSVDIGESFRFTFWDLQLIYQ